MNVERCAVPNCSSLTTTGIPFPKQIDLQKKWLDSLNLPDFVPQTNSFVCLDHFGNGDLLERFTDVDLENVLNELPIPVIATKHQKIEADSIDSCDNQDDEDTAICRLCMCQTTDKNVYDTIDENVTVSNLIQDCIPQIKILADDSLSKWICHNCFQILDNFHTFQQMCIKNNQQQEDTINNGKKRKCVEISASSKKARLTNKTAVDEKFDQVEAELMRALEGQIPEEMRTAENIIIEVQSDDDINDPIDENIVKLGSQQVKLPKGIKVKVNHPPKLPSSKAQIVEEISNTEFCLVDNYLFEYRLCKGNVRHLRCLVAKCKAAAVQRMFEPGVFDDQIIIKIAHNHPAPSADERKKQMFLHLMKRKMQKDKSLYFRNVYEEFCEKDPEIKRIVPLKDVINEICAQQVHTKSPTINSFERFYDLVETDDLQKLHFTHSNLQFYQEKFQGSDGTKAVVFANCETIERISDSKIMYVDASFKIETLEKFKYHLVSVLVWVTDSYYPIMFALMNEKSQEIYKLIFGYLHDRLAPKLRPDEIVTDYESALYYSLGEVYLDSHIGGSVFYYTQNLYKKICSLHLSRELETNSCFRNIYHMILMLPLLPVNTIMDGLLNIEQQAMEMGQKDVTEPIFDYVRKQWIEKVTPDLFCVHRLENRINENVIAPFKKLRDLIMLSKGKMNKQQITIITVVEKLIELEDFLLTVYSAPSKKSFARDLSSSQKKNVIRAWQFIESHPKININHFFNKVLGYIKCMENQLWIWGFYRFNGDADDDLINAANFSIVSTNDEEQQFEENEIVNYVYQDGGEVVVDIVIDQKDGFVVQKQQLQDSNFQQNYME